MHINYRNLMFVLTGVSIGIGIGILLAPGNGKETRRKLKYSTDSLKKRLGWQKEIFSDSELEMDATNGRSFGI